ncbi:MAG: TrpB-like pyridoxal phosphate-dependent enzyme [Candidatus Nomurabacteria bacterium]|jgi:tryptophan synthase beta chain|nr:TrpB-like pyridoxal phosphate-dependent enzyme [Candidatus Nomurabacteria bacterium]
MKTIPHKTYLTEDEMPRQYYNLRADMKKKPAPMLHPATLKPVTAADLEPVFCKELVRQELDDSTKFFDIPERVLDFYKIFRPSPLIRAYGLEKALDTPAKIYYKFEGNNTSGSHKLNSAAAQVYYAKAEGITTLTTETGAGQWGTALAEASAYFDIPLTVYMVKGSYEQKPFRKTIMRTFGAEIIASPSDTTKVGRAMLEKFPDTSGSLGCAISEAVEHAVSLPNARYVLGSVLNQVLLHQSIIGLETEIAFAKIGDYPDVIIGCAGGGSNLGGLIAPFMRDKLLSKKDVDIIAVEPESCPSLTRGRFAYDFCDTGHLTPLAKMYTLGSEFMPARDHAGGLRYHGMSPVISELYADGHLRAEAYKQTEVFEAATLFARVEQILPAPESAHAIKGAIEVAKQCSKSGEAKTILFGLSGTGNFDLAAYEQYQNGVMVDTIPTDADIAKSLKTLPKV